MKKTGLFLATSFIALVAMSCSTPSSPTPSSDPIGTVKQAGETEQGELCYISNQGDSTCDSGYNCCFSGGFLGDYFCDYKYNSMNNCGSCGNACDGTCPGGGEYCDLGHCACNTLGDIYCGHTTGCVNPNVIPNCGVCGNSCNATGETGACSNNECVCSSGWSNCPLSGPYCYNLQSDNHNCGSCNHVCIDGEICVSGNCQCPSGQTLCNGTCTTTCGNNCNNICQPGQNCCFNGMTYQCLQQC